LSDFRQLVISGTATGAIYALAALGFTLLWQSFRDHQFGKSVAGSSPRKILEHGVAYVPQGRSLFGSLSVLHNLELGGITLPGRKIIGEQKQLEVGLGGSTRRGE